VKYKLSRHKKDSAMIEALYINQGYDLLAFVLHEDCIDDPEIIDALERNDSVTVDLTLASDDNA